jgi:6-phosphogluconolactonase
VYVANNGSEQNDGGSIAGFRVNLTDGSLAPVPGSPFKTANGPAVVASDPQGRFVFVGEDQTVPGTRGSNCLDNPSLLLVERVDPVSGTLTQLSSTTLAGACVRAITVDPAGKHLYVGVASTTGTGGEIHGFLIGASGALTELAGSPVAGEGLPFESGAVPEGVAFEPTGKFVYTVSPNDGTIAGFVLDRSSGKLTPIAAKPFATGDNPDSLTIVQPR